MQDPSNLSLFRRSPRQGVQSFLVLNAASALLEGKDLDPEFKRILQLRRRDARADKVEYPHVTTLIQDRLQVQRLMDVVKTYLQPGS